MTAPRDYLERSGARAFLRLALELLVVFIGVSAAFAMSEYEKRRDAADRRHQLQLALVSEIEDITSNTRRVAEASPVMMARFDSLVAAGARPPLDPMIEPVRVDTHMWEATLQSGGLDLFDVPTVHRLSQFYNQLNAGFEQLDQLRTLSETVLIPNLGLGAEEFYDPADGQLRPKYQWYRSGMQRLGYLAITITAMGDSLARDLGTASRPGTTAAGH
jgi:hypothetical protein